MRKSNLLVMCFLAAGIFSCSKDDDAKLSAEIDPDGVNATEEVQIDINEASGGLIVEGATSKTGSITPTGDLAFSLDFSTQTAFQKNGFDIVFDASAEFAGAYIQLKDENGMADTYLDVPLSAMNNYDNKLTQNKRKNIFTKEVTTTRKEEGNTINVDFESSVPAGTFCYVICLYDAQGNISLPEDVCVTVEAWGGNVNLVADWEYTKEIFEGETINLGEAICEENSFTLSCDSGEVKEVEGSYCYTLNGFNLTFNSDGTYTYTQNSTDSNYDYDASQENCELVVSYYDETYTSNGNWAYNEDKEELTLIEFEYINTEAGDDQIYDIEGGDVVFTGEIDLSSNQLILKITDIYEGDTEYYEYHFNKK
ncbi:hypothetical protein [Cellulophaga baltica]|uniref:hypothetical protein n=1 Tax=Cellulophaga baltica TaxID=76594 RepID=UPI0012DD7DCA|nr:hypothetical protein [Cellulophaga baltica]